MYKEAIEKIKTASLIFFNRLFLVAKPSNKWRPILDLSCLNKFLKLEKSSKWRNKKHKDIFEWVMSMRRMGNVNRFQGHLLPYTYKKSRKYRKFHIQGQSYQFNVLLFGLFTAPMEFTVAVKEVKLMA